MDLGILSVGFQVDLSGLTSGISSAKDQLAGFSDASQQSSGGFLSGIGGMVGGLLNFGAQLGQTMFGVQALWSTAQGLGQSLLGPAISAETVTTALTTLDGSAAAAGAEMQRLNEFAAKTPFKTLDIDQAAEQLQGFGIGAGKVVPEITAIGDALGSVGRDTPAELDGVVQIFGKIHTEGKITAMTMNELAVHGINGWQALADATGKSIPEVKNLVAHGLLPANAAIDDLTKGIEMNPLYKGGMAKAAGTFTGLLSTLQSNWDQVIAAFGTPIIKALEGDLNNLGGTLASPVFQSFAGGVGQGIVSVFQGISGAVSGVAGAFTGLNFGDAHDALVDIGSSFRTAGQFLSSFLNHAGGVKSVLGPVGAAFHDLLQGGLSQVTGLLWDFYTAFDGVATGLEHGQGSFGFLQGTFQQLSKIVGGQLTADFQFLGQTVQQLGAWWQGTMGPAIQQSLPGFESLGATIVTTVIPALAQIWAAGEQLGRTLLPILIGGFETIAPIVVRVGGFLADNLGKAIKFIMPDVVSATTAISQFAEEISVRAEPVVKNISNVIGGFLQWIGPYWPSIWQQVTNDFTAAWDIIKGVVQIAFSIVSGIIKVGLDLASGNWKKAWDDMKDTFSGVWDGIKSIANGVWIEIGGGMKSGINGVIDLINDFIRSIDSIGIDVGPVHIHPDVPQIPHLSTGGFVPPGGMAIAGDPGPYSELVFGGPSGASVLSHSQSLAALAGGGGRGEIHVHNHNHIYLDGQEITDMIGGNVVSNWLNHGPVKTLRAA
jgi:tape measure domain-containing protein